jgi:hypothetical protein
MKIFVLGFGFLSISSYVYYVIRDKDMKYWLIEIGNLSEKLVLQLMSEGMSNDDAQDAVLVILKEHMEVGNTSIEDLRECVKTLASLINEFN